MVRRLGELKMRLVKWVAARFPEAEREEELGRAARRVWRLLVEEARRARVRRRDELLARML